MRNGILSTLLTASLVGLFTGSAIGQKNDKQGALYLLAATLTQPHHVSFSLDLYRVLDNHYLLLERELLPSQATGVHELSEGGTYSIHEIGEYFVIDYPHDLPSTVMFVSKRQPLNVQSVQFNPDGLAVSERDHAVALDKEGRPCDLWPLITDPPQINQRGEVISYGNTSLRSMCIDASEHIRIARDNWDAYRAMQWDGQPGGPSLPAELNGKIASGKISLAAFGAPEITYAEISAPIAQKFQEGQYFAGSSAVRIKAASARYLVIGHVGRDSDKKLFVRTSSNPGDWRVLPVMSDVSVYRLFGDWLSESVQTLIPRNNNSEMADQNHGGEVGGDLWPNAAEEYKRERGAFYEIPGIIALYNLTDGRKIVVNTGEEDSEVVQIFDGHTALMRIKDKLFLAEIRGSELGAYKLIAEDSAVSQVHWAFYSAHQ